MTLHRFLREVGNEIMSGAEKMVFSSFAMLVLAVVVLLIMITMPGGITGILEMHGVEININFDLYSSIVPSYCEG